VYSPSFPILQSNGRPSRENAPLLQREALHKALARAVQGEVRFDDGARALYATDASNYRQVPIGLVVPRDADDVIAAMRVCRDHGAPVLARGAGTSLAGQTCNEAVVFDYSKYMRRIFSIDGETKRAVVEPGVVLDRVREAAEQHKLTFGPDPATHSRCTLGGMIGNNSCGTHGLIAGLTSDNIEALDILLYDGTRLHVGATSEEDLEQNIHAGGRRGEIYAGLKRLREEYAEDIRARFPRIPRRVSGYNLDQLLPENGFNVARALVGSESTCITVLAATLRLVPSPQHRQLVVLGFADTFAAADEVPWILKWRPIGLEGFDEMLVEFMRRQKLSLTEIELLPKDCGGYLLVEFGADTAEDAEKQAKCFVDAAKDEGRSQHVRSYHGAQARQVWKIREQALGATVFVPGEPHRWEGWEDAAVPPDKLGTYLRQLQTLMERYDYRTPMYGHFGQGCIHMRFNFDMESTEGLRKYRAFIDQAADLVLSLGGSLSGEHGDGQSRGELLPKMFGPRLIEAFRQFKRLWDPDNRMNPGKMVSPDRVYSPTENIRLGDGYKSAKPQTWFSFPDDKGSFGEATLRCVGVGACRKEDAGTMCPSFMATREEKHSTRGRAHLLWELMQKDTLRDGFANEAVKEALDLCLSCKACKTECPVSVDMATYKAEFLAHYHESHPHPLRDYAFGRMDTWARLASRAPALANLSLKLPGARSLAGKLLDLAPERTLPRFAARPYTRGLPKAGKGAAGVVLWPDTWNNYFHPSALTAAEKVLRHAGLEPWTPKQHVCCGRPLYDFGMLSEARGYLRAILDRFAPQIDAGLPFVFLEPSCASVFQDELLNFFPEDPRARKLAAQTRLFADALKEFAPGFRPGPVTEAGALLHGHCHHKALGTLQAERELLEQACGTVVVPDTGCCGMAGPFGFEREKYAVSQVLGERVLLPAVRATAEESFVVSGGFSCREQIVQGTGRKAMHVAEVLALGIDSRG
jgi:FAD/FMN-containing dehydrogenase/Fe-S oxidoreductase